LVRLGVIGFRKLTDPETGNLTFPVSGKQVLLVLGKAESAGVAPALPDLGFAYTQGS
jgi:hypothetical protein